MANYPNDRSSNFENELDTLLDSGYRLDMIVPADSPTVAVVSKDGETIRLESNVPRAAGDSMWVTGRAGMEYRDLIPGRLDGRVIASHIRIPNCGEVADCVHYHKVDFQMIYCVAGAIRVVYEDQGEPFWLKPGDCVLQPPEIRHRVLEAEANSEVVEISSPAVHETWADHDLTLPCAGLKPDRNFSGQRFVRHTAADSTPVSGEHGSFATIHTGIAAASNDAACVFELCTLSDHSTFESDGLNATNIFYFVLTGRMTSTSDLFGQHKFMPGDCIIIPPRTQHRLDAPANSAILCVVI
jgi:quercetin dioxygenase-like cupin family protein